MNKTGPINEVVHHESNEQIATVRGQYDVIQFHPSKAVLKGLIEKALVAYEKAQIKIKDAQIEAKKLAE